MENAKLVSAALAEHGQLIMPGVYDALSAKIAARAGFEVIFVTGYSLSATILGEPDFGVLTQTEVVEAAQRICSVVDTPVIVDADTGETGGLGVGAFLLRWRARLPDWCPASAASHRSFRSRRAGRPALAQS